MALLNLPLRWLALGALLPTLACGGGSSGGTAAPADVAQSVLAADLDKDGRIDLAFALASRSSGPPHPGYLARRYQTAPGSFREPIRQEAGRDPVALAAGDLDGDGLPDLVVANTQTLPDPIQDGTLSLLLSGPQITLVLPPRTLALGRRDPLDLALADFNGDGRLDIAVAARGGKDLLLFLQTAAGVAAFGPAVILPLSAEPACLVAADLDGDGRPDLAVGLASGTLAVLLQDPAGATGPGLFRPAVETALGSHPFQLRCADLDADGRPDLAVTLDLGGLGGLGLLFQDPAQAGRFRPVKVLRTGDSNPLGLAIGDLDGDGHPEIVVANQGPQGWSGSVALFNDGGAPGAYARYALYPGYWGPRSIAIADVNGDGLPDLVLADGPPLVRFQVMGEPGYFHPPALLKY